jgi:hypothetical protein
MDSRIFTVKLSGVDKNYQGDVVFLQVILLDI